MQNQFQMLKRKIYTFMFPFLCMTLIVNNIIYHINGTTLHLIDKLNDALLFAGFLIGFVLLRFSKTSFRKVELFTVLIVTIVLIPYFQHSLFIDIPGGYSEDLGISLYWTPFLFIGIFLSFNKKQALFYP
jgi:hypothetical protein